MTREVVLIPGTEDVCTYTYNIAASSNERYTPFYRDNENV